MKMRKNIVISVIGSHLYGKNSDAAILCVWDLQNATVAYLFNNSTAAVDKFSYL